MNDPVIQSIIFYGGQSRYNWRYNITFPGRVNCVDLLEFIQEKEEEKEPAVAFNYRLFPGSEEENVI